MTVQELALEDRFDREMIALYRRILRVSKSMNKRYPPQRFLQAVEKRGAVGYIRDLVLPRSEPQDGTDRLIELGVPELSAEALALRFPYSQLFTAAELAELDDRLRVMRASFAHDFELYNCDDENDVEASAAHASS